MRIVQIARSGPAEVLMVGEAPTPEPQAGEVLIKVAAAGVNRADLMQREGQYPPPPGASPILGMEVSGEIVQVGMPGDARWKVGDPVCALVAGGGYAEFCVASAGCCLPVPASVSLVNAAALPEAVFTVWANLLDKPYLKANDRFLVQGGTSGIGTMAIQIAKSIGARVITTAGSKEKCDYCVELGAERAFNYREDDWATGAMEWADQGGVNVILDMVAGDYFPKHLKLLATEGTLVQIATARGAELKLDMRAVMTKRLTITGSTLRPRSVAEKTALRDCIEERLWPVVAAGEVRPIVDRVYPFEQAVEAHRRMESSEHIGKLLLTVA